MVYGESASSIALFDNIDPDQNFFSNFQGDLCQYYTLNDYISLPNDVQNFCVLNYNIRSFNANSTTFESFIDFFNIKHDCIVLTETWNTESNIDFCKIEGYSSSHTYRQNSRGGEVSIFCSDHLSISKCETLSRTDETIESCAVQLVSRGIRMIIIGIYRPPSGNIMDFITALEFLLININLDTNFVILAGDLNINLTNVNCENFLLLSSTLSSMHFLPLITKPTRFSPGDFDSTPTTLDHIWVNSSFQSKSGIIYYDVTDHMPCFYHCKLPTDIHSTDKIKIQTRPFTEQNLQNFIYELTMINWDNLLDYNDIDLSLNAFMHHLNQIYVRNFPMKTKFLSYKRMNNPWITPNVKHLINKKSEHFNLYRRGLITKQTNNQFKNKLNKDIKNAKSSYFLDKLEQHKNDSKRSWNILRQLSGRVKSREEIIQLLNGDDVLTDKKDIANKFSDFFASIALDLDNNLPISQVSPYTNIENNPRTFFIYPVTATELENIVSNLKITKTELNQMPVKLFKAISNYISEPLKNLINLSFSSGNFPKSLKLARITPIFKKGDKNNSSNYRPITSLPFISKIYERCMTNRLISFINKYSLFSNSQYGFRNNLSTQDALLDLTETIYNSLNNKKYQISIMIDLKKAFDSVNNNILLKKLELYGIRGMGLSWIQSYLADRVSYVALGKVKSNLHTTNIGIPQGSIIGPILFLIYINDLPKTSNKFHTTLFADDTTFSLSDDNYDTMVTTLNSELTKVENWTNANRLTINVTKTEMLFFSNRPIININNNQIILDNQFLNYTNSCTFLGVILDDKLKSNS